MLIKKIFKLLSRITVRLMLFNILLIFFPIAFFFYLDIYENKLLTAQENSMVMQARIVSSSLKNSANLEQESNRLIDNLNMEVTSRIRIISETGNLLVDSSRAVIEEKVNTRYDSKIDESSIDDNILYRMVRFPLNVIRYILRGPIEATGVAEYYVNHSYLDGYELKLSLDGLYGATTRISSGGERSVTLYISLPIFDNKNNVTGVVLLSNLPLIFNSVGNTYIFFSTILTF